MSGRGAILPALLGIALALPGCDSGIRSDAESGLENGRRLTAAERVRMRAVQRGEILREERPFYGTAVEVERGAVSGTPLPRSVEGARGVSLSLSGQADIKTVAAAITAATDIPVNIRTRYVLPDGSAVRVPIGTKMTVQGYEGPLSAFLDRLAARMDVGWAYDGKVVTIDRMTRRTWRVALPFGSTEMNESASLANGTVSVDTVRRIDPWQDLEDRLAALAPPPAQVTLSPQTGRVEALAPPSVHAALDAVIRDVADVASMRIGLEVAVYWVLADRADEFGTGASVEATGGGFGAALAAAAGGLADGGLVISRGESTIGFLALARDVAVVDYRLASTVAQSGVVTPIQITREENFVRSATREDAPDDDDPGSVTFEVDTLETGLSVAALPRLVGPRRIQLALTLRIRELVDMPDIQGGGDTYIQLPIVDNREIRNQTVLAPGETLVLSGYEQEYSRDEDEGLGFLRRIGLGGTSEAATYKARMVLLVRPTLIPSGGRA